MVIPKIKGRSAITSSILIAEITNWYDPNSKSTKDPDIPGKIKAEKAKKPAIIKRIELLNENIKYSIHKNFGKTNDSPIILGGVYLILVVLLFFNSDLIILKFIWLIN